MQWQHLAYMLVCMPWQCLAEVGQNGDLAHDNNFSSPQDSTTMAAIVPPDLVEPAYVTTADDPEAPNAENSVAVVSNSNFFVCNIVHPALPIGLNHIKLCKSINPGVTMLWLYEDASMSKMLIPATVPFPPDLEPALLVLVNFLVLCSTSCSNWHVPL